MNKKILLVIAVVSFAVAAVAFLTVKSQAQFRPCVWPNTCAQVQPCVWPNTCYRSKTRVVFVGPCPKGLMCKEAKVAAMPIETCVWPHTCKA